MEQGKIHIQQHTIVGQNLTSQENTDDIYEQELLKIAKRENDREKERAQMDHELQELDLDQGFQLPKRLKPNTDDSSPRSETTFKDSSRSLHPVVKAECESKQNEDIETDIQARANFFKAQNGLTGGQNFNRRPSVQPNIDRQRRVSVMSGGKRPVLKTLQKMITMKAYSSKSTPNTAILNQLFTEEEPIFNERQLMNNPNPVSRINDEDLKEVQEDWRRHPMNAILQSSQVHMNKARTRFVQAWSKLILACITFIFFTTFFFLGISGFPTGTWILMEIIVEIIVVADFVFRQVTRVKYPEIWKDMTLLHDQSTSGDKKWFYLVLFASCPQSLLLNYVFLHDPTTLNGLPIAIARCIKLIQMRQVKQYFAVVDLQFRRISQNSFMKTAQVLYYLGLFIHWVTCMWLFVNRIDPETDVAGWYNQCGYSVTPHTIWDEYLDSLFWSNSQMAGAGFGEFVPSTTIEWIVCSCVEIFGASIFIGFYADISVELYARNKISIANNKNAEDAKQFATLRKMPEEIFDRILQYYSFMKIQFDEYLERHNLLSQLPDSLRKELTLIFNSELIQNVNFFQLAEPDFILKLTMECHPQICVVGDFVFKSEDMADNFYFIHQGQVEILNSDETLIAYQGKGSYFGEIGVLLTGKRTATVRTFTIAILYYIEKNRLIHVLDQYPKQAMFLRAVGRQRLQTQDTPQLEEWGELTVRGLEQAQEYLIQQSSTKDQFFRAGTIQREKKKVGMKLGSSIQKQIDSQDFQEQKNRAHRKHQKMEVKNQVKPWLTQKHSLVPHFVIVPFSCFHIVWNIILVLTISFYIFIVPFNLALAQDIDPYANAVGHILMGIDMIVRPFTAHKDSKTLCFDRQELINYYINEWLLYDMLSTFPIELLLIPLVTDEVCRWVMLLKLFKMNRLLELSQVLKHNCNVNGSLATLLQLFFVTVIGGHFSSCIIAYIGAIEYFVEPKSRFDSKTLFWSMNAITYSITGPLESLTPYELYWQMYYNGGNLFLGSSYGDSVPWAPSELMWALITLFGGRVMIAFIAAESALYLQTTYQSIEHYTSKVNFQRKWMQQTGFPPSLIKRVMKYHKQTWQDQGGVNDQEILDNLPQTLKVEIRTNIFISLVDNWDLLKFQNNQGIRSALISMLKLVLYPKNEYIIRVNEIACEMYFIISGTVCIKSKENKILFTLSKGAHFGEMALFDKDSILRGASVVSTSKVTLAKLLQKDFDQICSLYPNFDEKIKQSVQVRRANQAMKPMAIAFQKLFAKKALELSQSFIQENSVISYSGSQMKAIKTKSQSSLSKFSRDEADRLKIMQAEIERKAELERQAKLAEKEKRLEAEKKIGDKSNIHKKSSGYTSQKFKIKPEEQKQKLIKQMEDHFNDEQKIKKSFKKIKGYFSRRNIMRFTIFILSLYNLIFVPMQFAFRMSYNGWILAMEILTISFYLLDAIMRFRTARLITRILETPLEDLENPDDYKMKLVREETLKIRRRNQKIEIACSLVASVPWSAAFAYYSYWEPWYITNFVSTIRCFKIRPILKFFDLMRSRNLNVWRAIEVIFYYYAVTHYWSCIMVSEAAYQEDANRTWLRRCPFPMPSGNSPSGKRANPHWFETDTGLTAYIHAFYFLASAYSHVNIGDVTAVNQLERIGSVWIGITGLFMYYYLFSNIVSMVSSLTSASRITFEQEFKKIMVKIKNGRTPDQVIINANAYLDYHKAMYDGLDEQEFLENLPYSIKSDILLSRYAECVEKSIIFRDNDEYIDITTSNSVFSYMKIKFFMENEFIVKLGQHTTDSVIILDGVANVIGAHQNEFLGLMSSGFHFGNDLSTNKRQTNKSFAAHLNGETLRLQTEQGYNFENKAMLHLTAKSFVVVGFISQEDRNKIYQAYPHFKKKMQCVNQFLSDIGQLSLEKETQNNKYELNTKNCEMVLDNNITYSTQNMYDAFLAEVKAAKIGNSANLGQTIKDFYVMEYFDQEMNPIQLMKKMQMMGTLNQPKVKKDKSGSKLLKELGPDELKLKTCVLEANTNLMQGIQLIQFVNLLYIAFFIPMHIGWTLDMSPVFIFLEGASLIVSFIFFCITFCTPVIVDRVKTAKCKKVAKVYWEKDMIIDLLGLCPLNLALGIHFGSLSSLDSILAWQVFVAFLRFMRVGSIFKMIKIFSDFQAHFKVPQLATNLAKTFLVFMLMNHFAVCAWMYCQLVLEKDLELKWLTWMGLQDSNYAIQYLRSFYAIQNIVTTTGSGDVYATTDLERCFFVLLITGGDILFSLAFGFIASLTAMGTVNNDSNRFVEKIVRIERYMDEYKMSLLQKKRVEEYFAYEFIQKGNLTILDRDELFQKLPQCLAMDIFFHNFREQLNPMFAEFGSENFIRELCSRLVGKIYLPGDYVIERGQIAQQMYFVSDGLVHQIAIDKKTAVGRFYPGDYFGELGVLFEGLKRTQCMQAQSFCLLNELRKEDVDDVAKSYLKVAECLKVLAEEKKDQIERLRMLAKEDRQELMFDGVIGLSQCSEMLQEQGTFDYNNSLFSDYVPLKKDNAGNLSKSILTPKARNRPDSSKNIQGHAKVPKQDSSKKILENALYIVDESSDTNSSQEASISNSTLNLDEKILSASKIQRQKTTGEFRRLQSQTHQIRGRSRQIAKQSEQQSKMSQPPGKKKTVRRLSGVCLSRTLKLSQKTGLKLHWAIDN